MNCPCTKKKITKKKSTHFFRCAYVYMLAKHSNINAIVVASVRNNSTSKHLINELNFLQLGKDNPNEISEIINYAAQFGKTAFFTAYESNHEMVKILGDIKECDINKLNNGNSSLFAAIEHDNYETVEYLLNHPKYTQISAKGASSNITTHQKSQSSFELILECHKTQILTITNKYGWNVFITLSHLGNQREIKMVLNELIKRRNIPSLDDFGKENVLSSEN